MTTRYHGSVCKTCRRRGRKCTREIPECQTCLKKGLRCEGYTWKWSGVASRGKHAKKSAPVPDSDQVTPSSLQNDTQGPQDISSIPESPPDAIIELNEDDFVEQDFADALQLWTPSFSEVLGFQSPNLLLRDEDHENTTSSDSAESNDFSVMPSISYALDATRIPSDLKFILNYYLLEVASKLCVDNNAPRNPYREYIHPLAIQRPQLLYACGALSAIHFSTTQSNQSFYGEALRLRGKALRRLREYFWSDESAKEEGNLAAILMLTLCDLAIGAHSNFTGHFSAAKKLIDLRGGQRTPNSFVEQYISWLDIMSAASTSRKPVFTLEDLNGLGSNSQSWSYDVFPCPPDLFAILAEIVEYSKSPDFLVADELTRHGIYDGFREKIMNCPPHNERGAHWLSLTESYRFGILLYTGRLYNITIDEDELNWLVSSLFYSAKSTPVFTGWADQLLWPLFHVGLEIRDSRRQEWIRCRFSEMQTSGGFRNVSMALEVLEKVWRGEESRRYDELLHEEGLGEMIVI